MKKIFFTTLIIFSFFLSISRFLIAAPICLISEENKTQIEEKVPDIKNEENEIIINEEKRTKEEAQAEEAAAAIEVAEAEEAAAEEAAPIIKEEDIP